MSEQEEKNHARGNNDRGSDNGDATPKPASGGQLEPASVNGNDSGKSNGTSGTSSNGTQASVGNTEQPVGKNRQSEPSPRLDGGRNQRNVSEPQSTNRGSNGTNRGTGGNRGTSRSDGTDSSGSRSDGTTTGTRPTTNQEKTVVPLSQKTPKKVAPKPTSLKNKKSAAKKDDIHPDDITNLIVAIFNVAGGIMGAHWFVSHDEAEQIAQPLSIIWNKQNAKKKKKASEMMAPAMLAMALGTIILPRILITAQEWREKANERKQRKHLVRNQNAERGKNQSQTDSISGTTDGQIARDIGHDQEARHANKNDDERIPTVPPTIHGLFAEGAY